ncbi:C-C motif chemokine 7 [Alligator sinensis]|uniref:C-C motif chemokine n=1 Tax=Alligator sinensis TaxID=38654 RepID=A0A1U7RZG4_ALLSI|nr:C-C motif chemokine 7 [Alligator sinensis]
MAPHLLLLLLLAVLGLRCPQGSDAATDCCLTLSSKRIPPRIVTSYRVQTPESGCRLRAVVFITKQDVKLCASPHAPWVPGLMKKLDKKLQPPHKPQKQKRGPKPQKQDRV